MGGGGGGRGHFHGKVIGMLVVFSGYKILVFLGFSGKFCAEMKFWCFRVCLFCISSKNEKVQKVFSKICIIQGHLEPAIWVFLGL